MQSTIVETLPRYRGVARVSDLVANGHPVAAIDRLVARGGLVRLRRGWVALPDAHGEVVRAARLGGVLSCVSVLRPLGVWTGEDARLHLQVRQHAHVPDHGADVVTHRHHGLGVRPPRGAVDSVESALVHATRCLPRLDAIGALDSALNRRLVTESRLAVLLAQLPLCYRSHLDFVDGAAESGLESRVRVGVRAVGIGHRVQVEIDGVGRVDILIGERLVVEVDGSAWHSGHEAFVADRRRDLALARRGYLVVRLSYAQVMHGWPATLEVLRGIVARGEHRWAARHGRGLAHAERPPTP
jgi:very-short-patch-repair endonuclease